MTTSLDKLIKATGNFHRATNATQRDAAKRFVIKRVEEVIPERDAIHKRLNAGFDYLNNHDDDTATEALWMADLETYERIEDALANALAIFTGEDVRQERRTA